MAVLVEFSLVHVTVGGNVYVRDTHVQLFIPVVVFVTVSLGLLGVVDVIQYKEISVLVIKYVRVKVTVLVTVMVIARTVRVIVTEILAVIVVVKVTVLVIAMVIVRIVHAIVMATLVVIVIVREIVHVIATETVKIVRVTVMDNVDLIVPVRQNVLVTLNALMIVQQMKQHRNYKFLTLKHLIL